MVWQTSRKFGCGKARSRSGKVIAVALYFPKGNIPGEFHDNVLPPVEDSDEESETIEQNGLESKSCRLRSALLTIISCAQSA